MTIMVTRGGVTPDSMVELERLERLVADLRRIVTGQAPTSGELDQAPLLDSWTLATFQRACLVGEVHGHPLLRGPRIETSELCAIAPEIGWARTTSRFYRLGRPLGTEGDA